MNNKFLAITLFTGLFLFTACGGNDKVGVGLDCEKSGWLSGSVFVNLFNTVSHSAYGPFNNPYSRPSSQTTEGPLEITEAKIYNIIMWPQDESAVKNTATDVPMIEELGYTGTYGGFLSFTPKKTALYRIYTSEEPWFSIKKMESNKLISAKRYIGSCVDQNNKPVQKIVEFSLKKDKKYSIQLLNSKTAESYFFVYTETDKK